MDFTVSVLLGTFILSIAALFVFIWSLSNGLFGDGFQAATEIFVPNELGRVEDPAATAAQIKGLQQATGTASEGVVPSATVTQKHATTLTNQPLWLWEFA